MSNQPTLFDAIAASAAKEQALVTVEKNANAQWKIDVFTAINSVARRLKSFTSDDVWKELEGLAASSTHEPRALGAIMRLAAARGVIVPTDSYRPSCRVACHARPVRVWQSLVYNP